jgi:hypothetical protein
MPKPLGFVLETLESLNVCTVPHCFQVNYPFCEFHERMYQEAGPQGYEFYRRWFTGCCPYCGSLSVDLSRQFPAERCCPVHQGAFEEACWRQASLTTPVESNNQMGRSNTVAQKMYRWSRYGVPVAQRPWEWL